MERLRKFLETGANVAIIIVAVLLVAVIVERYVVSNNTTSSPSKVDGLQLGMDFPLKGIDISKKNRTLFLVLSTNCRYCTESLSFYKDIVEKNAANPSISMIAVFPQELSESTKYLQDNGVRFDEIVKANPSEMSVNGTPTLVLTDNSGTILELWIGKLPEAKQNEVMNRLFNVDEKVKN